MRSQRTLRRKETFGQALVRGQATRAQQSFGGKSDLCEWLVSASISIRQSASPSAFINRAFAHWLGASQERTVFAGASELSHTSHLNGPLRYSLFVTFVSFCSKILLGTIKGVRNHLTCPKSVPDNFGTSERRNLS
jgi:hypothetical protein